MTIGIWQIGLIVVIVILLFGTKKLRTLGADLGASIKGFKKAISEEETNEPKDNEHDADFSTPSALKDTQEPDKDNLK